MGFWSKLRQGRRSTSRPVDLRTLSVGPVHVLDYAALNERLLQFEDEHALLTGARLTSAEFHDMYRRGDADEVVNAFEWATYYELVREYGQRAAEEHREAVEQFVEARMCEPGVRRVATG